MKPILAATAVSLVLTFQPLMDLGAIVVPGSTMDIRPPQSADRIAAECHSRWLSNREPIDIFLLSFAPTPCGHQPLEPGESAHE